MSRLLRATFWLSALTAISIQPGQSGECLKYAPAENTITGVLHIVHGYGPPNFGETPATDIKTDFAIVDLEKPVCVTGGGELDEPRPDIRQIELVPAPHSLGRYTDLINMHVRVIGKLSMHNSGTGSPADIVMAYTAIRKD